MPVRPLADVDLRAVGREVEAAPLLALLESDLQAGKNLTALPQELAQAMLANLRHPADLSEEIVGDVAL